MRECSDDEVDQVVEGEQGRDGVAVGGGDDGDGGLGEARRAKGVPDDLAYGVVARRGVPAALEDDGVARTQRERGRVAGDVGPGLVDDGHDTERRSDAGDAQAVGSYVVVDDAADRIGLCRDLVDGARHAFDALAVEGEPVEERWRQVGVPSAGNVGGVGVEDGVGAVAQGGRDLTQRVGSGPAGRRGEDAGGVAGEKRAGAERSVGCHGGQQGEEVACPHHSSGVGQVNARRRRGLAGRPCARYIGNH